MLLDLVLPDVDGIELMGQVPELADLPVIFISAYRRDETVARALEAGAVDYIAKPFSPTELISRVRAALRHRESPEAFAVGDLAIDYARRRVTVGGKAVELTATEYELLRILSLDAGRVVTFETLLPRVWPKRDSTDANLVRNFVRNLRAQARRKRGQPRLAVQRARRRLPHGEAARPMRTHHAGRGPPRPAASAPPPGPRRPQGIGSATMIVREVMAPPESCRGSSPPHAARSGSPASDAHRASAVAAGAGDRT